MEITGKAAMVVGGASGMARATAELLVRGGARVAILDLPTSKGEEAAAALGGGTRFLPCDVTDFAATEAAIAEACVQLWGEGGARQVPGGPEVAVAASGGGPLGGCLLITKT